MSVRNFYLGATALMLALAPAATMANQQDTAAPAAEVTGETPALKVGATVADPAGNAVGTIDSVEGEFVTISTGTNKVRIPVTSVAVHPTGPVIGMTRADLDAAAAASQDLSDILVVGATVGHNDGSAVGTVDAIEGEFVTLSTATTNTKVRLPQTAFARGPNGLIIGMTAAELDAAASASGADAASPPADEAATDDAAAAPTDDASAM